MILGLLTGTVVLSLIDRQHNLDLKTWTEQFSALDHQTRERAESQGIPWRIVVDFEQQRVWNEAAKNNHQETDPNDFSAPRGWKSVFAYATNQVSHSYALGLRNDKDQTFWLLTAGGTGQMFTTDYENEIEDIFAALHAAGDDAG